MDYRLFVFFLFASIGKVLIICLDFFSASRSSLSFCRFIQNSVIVLNEMPKAQSSVRLLLAPTRPFRIPTTRLLSTLLMRVLDLPLGSLNPALRMLSVRV